MTDVSLEQSTPFTDPVSIHRSINCLCPARVILTSMNIEICPDCKKLHKLCEGGVLTPNVGSSKDRGL